MPIDGLVSGLDTNSIITQLMDLERRPRTAIQTRRDSIQAGLDGLKAIEAKLATASTAARALQLPSGWALRSASSSNPAVAVTATSSAGIGSFSFKVDSLARAHGVATAVDVAATTTVIASTGEITINKNGTDHVLSVGGGTLAEVAQAVNDSGLGLRAATVNTGTGYRLQLSSAATGASSQFSVSAGIDGAGGTVVTTLGSDAVLTLGSGPGAYQITSASNTFAEVMPGVAITVNATTADPVVVDVAADATALGDRIKTMVDAVNGALGDIAARTAYDPATKRAAPLTGDAAARRVAQALTRAVTEAVSQSALHSAGLAGVSLDKTGKLTFDRARFEAAFQADPAAVQRLFVQGATTTGTVEFVSALDRTTVASGDVSVSALPTTATDTGLTAGWPVPATTTVRVRIGATTAEYEIQPTDLASDARAGLQAAINAVGLSLDVTESGLGLAVTHRSVGTSASFEVAWDGDNYTSHAGTDIAGTIDVEPANGTGWLLSSPPTATGPLAGITVRVTAPGTGVVGSIDYEPGLAQRISQAIAVATDATNGYMVGSETSRAANITALDTTLAAYDVRLAAREAKLRKQFVDLEVALGNLRNQSNWLTSQLAQTTQNNNR